MSRWLQFADDIRQARTRWDTALWHLTHLEPDRDRARAQTACVAAQVRYREALEAMRIATVQAIAEVEPEVPAATEVPAPPLDLSWHHRQAQEQADRTGETMLVLPHADPDIFGKPRPGGPYVTAKNGASKWELEPASADPGETKLLRAIEVEPAKA